MATRTLVLCPNLKENPKKPVVRRSPELQLAEALSLASTLGVDIIHAEAIALRETRPSTLLGTGRVEWAKEQVDEHQIELVIIDHRLSPIQQRNLEKAWNCKVIDRTAMIIEIFAARARTSEGKLQVDLAALEYRKSRLVRAWTHLERQRGGLGNIGGPGETQIEADRRILGVEISKIKRELQEVKRTRQLHRTARKKVPYPIVALVGYTNAGKSTLFNRLTGATVLAEDKLFATLDPTMRLVTLPSKRTIILSDTVGFISDLPTELVAAFHATLEEVQEADLLLHVRDMSDPAAEIQRSDVEKVLENLGVKDKMLHSCLEVGNKVDAALVENRCEFGPGSIPISALTGEGCDALLAKIDAFFDKDTILKQVTLPPSAGKQLAWLYRHATILSRTDSDDATTLTLRITERHWEQYAGIAD